MAHKYLAMFRAVLVETLLLQTLYAQHAPVDRRLVWLLLVLYTLGGAALFWLGRKGRLNPQVSLVSFLGDILMTELILYFSGVLERDFYLAYFLVILATCLLENLAFSFIVGGVACLVYGAVAFPGWESFDPAYPLRLAVLLATSFFSTYVIDRARAIQQMYTARMASMQRLTLFGQALAGVLHEVKTPLGTIALTAEYVRELLKLGRAEEADERLAVIESEASRAAAIIADKLDFARPTELQLAPLDLREPLRKTLDVLRPRLLDRDVRAQADLGEPLPILGSERHLMQVFTIALMNAVDAMPFGGTLTVACGAENGRALARIKDSGAGIAPEVQAKLFEPFSSHKDGGTGLGLTIARWIIEKHGGTISIFSAGRDKGAEVTVDLPIASS